MKVSLKLIRTMDVGVAGRREIDLTSVPSGIVGVTGDVGIGKTILIEAALPGSVWLRMPSRVPTKPAHCAVSRKAKILSVWSIDGEDYTFEHDLDGGTQKHKKATIRGPDGKHVKHAGVTADGKVGPFKIVRDHLFGGDTWESVAASVFWVQKGGGAFTRLGQTEAKGVLSQLLGAQRHAAVHKVVSQWQKELRAGRQSLEDKERSLRESAQREQKRGLDACRARRDLLQASRLLGRARSALSKTMDVDPGAVSPDQLEVMRRRKKILKDDIATAERRVREPERVERLERALAEERTLKRLRSDAFAVSIPEHDVDDAEWRASMSRQVLGDFQSKLASCQSAKVRDSVPCRGRDKFSACHFLPPPPSVQTNPANEQYVARQIGIAEEELRKAERVESSERRKQVEAQDGAQRLAVIRSRIEAVEERVITGAEAELDSHHRAVRDLQQHKRDLNSVRGRLAQVSVADEDAAEARRIAVAEVNGANFTVVKLRERIATLEEYANDSADVDWRTARAELAGVDAEILELQCVRDAFHASGIPEALVRSAGPEVARRATEMLIPVVGHERFIVDLDDGVHVTDTSRALFGGPPQRKVAANLSGGQEALVESAVRMAVAEVSASRGATRWLTIFTDEMSSGLGKIAPAWVELLRESARRQEVRHLLLVSHDPRVIACVDTELELGGNELRRIG